MPKFKAWLETEEGKEFASDRDIKGTLIDGFFNSDAIEKIDEGVLRKLVRVLWSFGGWNNKDWLLEQMLKSGLPTIKASFKTLLYSNKSLAERFDQMGEIKMMGSATISEILTHHDPTEYAIYNRRAKFSLVKLGVNEKLLPKYAQISGSQYEAYVKVVKGVLEKVKQAYPDISDLLKLDFLLYFISAFVEEKRIETLAPIEKDHDALVLQVLQLGDGLGFDIEKDVLVFTGCRVDALWKSRVANLGIITYAFEVQKKGSRDSAILNLQRMFNADPTIQRAVIVSDDSEIEKFRAEMAHLDEKFRNAIGYFRIEDLQEAIEHQEALKNILSAIGLMKVRQQT